MQSDPAEHRGTVGIRPNHLLRANLTLYQPGWAEEPHHLEMSQPNFKPFRRACYIAMKPAALLVLDTTRGNALGKSCE